MTVKATIILTLAVVAIGLLMATPFHAIGVAVGGDRGGDVGSIVWRVAMVVGGIVYVGYLLRARRAAGTSDT